ncbi:galactokinase [Desulfococcaceae bacterium OttesenSCG-928-F15]|nr:galactokinase [Desulfococcaceae bacterium OttesenSCG-928-F15]
MPRLSPKKEWRASAPCRVDLGGTLDLPLFYYTLGDGLASTFNMALDLRTEILLKPFEKGKTAIASRGFSPAVFPNGKAPYNHPMGLVFAMLDAFGAGDLSLEIHSASPPRSSLGGSSVLSVALVALLMGISGELSAEDLSDEKRAEIVLRAWNLESAITRVPGGMQDYLAAAYGGVHHWEWLRGDGGLPWRKREIFHVEDYPAFSSCVLLAYCGDPHDSIQANERSIQGYFSGESRADWERIAFLSRGFSEALSSWNFEKAISSMNEELDIRLRLTPDILDAAGKEFVRAARGLSCGARFTGAGGGGCVWALGTADKIISLRKIWEDVAELFPGACVLDAHLEMRGVILS